MGSERKKVMKKLCDMAFGSSNDVAKLAFLKEDDACETVNKYDLTMLSEVKRGQNGSVELKLINRLDVIKLLLDELRPPEESDKDAITFLTAVNAAAKSGETWSDVSEH